MRTIFGIVTLSNKIKSSFLKKTANILFVLIVTSVSVGQSRIVEVFTTSDTMPYMFVEEDQLYDSGWSILAQPNFWRKVMEMNPDVALVNVARTREILFETSFIEWKEQKEEEKDIYKDSLRTLYGLDSLEKIYVTSGKNHFYQFDKVLPSISRGIEIFRREEVDPFYAQSILLIESPGKLDQMSNAGALGPFQLMKRVARKYGLKINRYIDERRDFDKSAVAASKLIGKSCIPMAKKILYNQGIKFNENDLWFKLFVLHIYHAGAGNVGALVQHLSPKKGGMSLIQMMWQNEYAGFKNASQNYSQVALASNLILYEMMYEKCDFMYDCNSFVLAQ